ncbi:MAG: hypothetical protein M1819_003855 [Sarea resinae]|nr:MAG: hypothetical protein M1819_003855 [Sarea resinae]
MASKTRTPDITLYTTQTPNGIKISITLEELGLPYKTEKIDISKNTQKEPWFLAINPNGRIPALTDKFTDGKQINLFESGSIMQYLVEQYDSGAHKISYPAGSRETYEVNNWLFFLNAGVGPMQGQANHFNRYAPERIPYGINRYLNETRRLYKVLDTHLAGSASGYLVGDKCTIADIAHYGWISAGPFAGVELEEFPNLKKWQVQMSERDGVKKGQDVPEPNKMLELLKDPAALNEYLEKNSKWVVEGMKQDAKK